ncbi:hypothetical protein HGRIS_011010 [Hohenbuehelia grisea]|uniref:Uncharacterized protein n=1 Tax=Hohenbuehelia grisea TaxID=104357 RepID=A0ABR3IYW9_9AGAR
MSPGSVVSIETFLTIPLLVADTPSSIVSSAPFYSTLLIKPSSFQPPISTSTALPAPLWLDHVTRHRLSLWPTDLLNSRSVFMSIQNIGAVLRIPLIHRTSHTSSISCINFLRAGSGLLWQVRMAELRCFDGS